MLFQITAPHFCAGFGFTNGVDQIAPIIRYMRDWSLEKIEAYCEKKGWTMALIQPNLPIQPAQAEMITCQICGNTWTTDNSNAIKRAWKHKMVAHIHGPLCDFCWTLYSLRNQANVQGLSLRQVVKDFLWGEAQRTHKSVDEIWQKNT